MTKKDNSLALLPNGFIDLLPPFAEIEAAAVQILMGKFSSFGYVRVKPPLLEFEDSLLGFDLGSHLSKDTFRLMDPVTHRMLGLRSDSTAQISRIVSSRFDSAPRPLRLAYANDVLRTRGSQIRSERQFTQVGCEFIGNDNCVYSDIEICVLSILGLKSLGVTNITLDLTIPNFVSSLLSGDDNDDIKKAVARRDVDYLLPLNCEKAQILAKIILSSGGADVALAALSDIDLPDSLSSNITHLKAVCAGVNSALLDLGINDVSITIDVLEQNGFEYHKNFGFTLFAENVRGELGSGGCYDINFGDRKVIETARGFTLYMDSITKIVNLSNDVKSIFVSVDQPWKVIVELQEQGWQVIRGIAGDYKDTNCTHIYENEEIIGIKQLND